MTALPRLFLAIALATLPVLTLPGIAQADGPLAFRNDGGEAWTFRKTVEGTVASGACDRVEVTSPLGSAVAEVDGTRFTATVPLASGDTDLRAVCLHETQAKTSDSQRWTVRLPDTPKAWVRAVATADGLVLDAGRSEPAEGDPSVIAKTEWRAAPGNPAPIPSLPSAEKRLTLPTPPADGEYRVTLRVTDALGRTDESMALFRVRNGRAEAVDPQRHHPIWMAGAVVYGVVPHLFGPRGLADVTARLDDIAALGATALWLSPLTEAPGLDFGYAVIDHFRVRARFGSEDDLKALVAAAHARGLRVLMDFVPNHLDEHHPYHADAAAHGPASPYYRFFDRKPDGAVSSYFAWTNLKNLNYDNPEVRRYMTAAFAHWVRDLGIDGFRVDASWAVKERAPEFWPGLRAELRRINPDLLLLAEASSRDPWYVENGFDAAYDWTDQLGQWAWHDAFDDGAPTAARLRAALSASAPGTPVFRFLNNNDTGARFITRHGLARTKVAAALLMTLPGIPGLYTGDEVGAAYEPYGEPKPIAWDDPQGLRPIYTRLSELRRNEPALQGPTLEWLYTASPDTVLAYRRPGPEPVTVVLNFGAGPAEPPRFAGPMRDLLTGTVLPPGATLPPTTAWVLKPANTQM
ncbi:alpha-amylase family glycosyl hydrolase [Azospirillum canadense]|uniref:alpha-amylase family glycosyl hydrolase n=1 Tax=Azospirillum canadense TaxID=403962 RepID=UPI00222675F5|nr:alpha-amylase family glycosyl hydrolase [Azospirillum canadense]MCW2243695.1 glycosidase [Azospirillum canadense]